MNNSGTKYKSSPMAKNNTDSPEKEKNQSVAGSIASFGAETIKKAGEGVADIGKGIFEQLLNQQSNEQTSRYEKPSQSQEEQPKPIFRPEGGTLFNFRNLEEEREINEIRQLIQQIKQEIEAIKKRSSEILNSVKDIENAAINDGGEQKGVYVLDMLRRFTSELQKVGMSIGNSSNWLEAMQTKKAKRGSLFAARTKSKGTQYSMSQELSNARSIQ